MGKSSHTRSVAKVISLVRSDCRDIHIVHHLTVLASLKTMELLQSDLRLYSFFEAVVIH